MRNKAEKQTKRDNETLSKALDNVFDKSPEYLIFWDKGGILEGALWILFEQPGKCTLKILPDPDFGDIMLCIDTGTSGGGETIEPNKDYEAMINCEPDPYSIVGFAVIASQEPNNIPAYLKTCRVKMHLHCKLSWVSGYKRAVYEYILAKLQRCNVRCVKGLTMQTPGLVTPSE